MADGSGRLDKVGLGRETTRGVAATAGFWVPQTTIDFHNKKKQIQDNSVFGILNEVARTDIANQWAEGKIDGLVGDRSIGLILLAALGQQSTTLHPSESAVYDTTFTQSQSNLPTSLTITRKDLNSDNQHVRGMLKTLELDIMTGEYVKFSSDWMAAKGTSSTDTPVYTLENRFRPNQAIAKMASTVAGLSSATAIPLKSLKLTISCKLQADYVFGSLDVNEIFRTGFTVKGDMTLRYTDQTYESLFYADSPQALSIDLKNTGVTIGSATNPELLLTMPQLTFEDWTPDQDKDKIMDQTIAFQGQYNFGSSAELTALVTNTQNGY